MHQFIKKLILGGQSPTDIFWTIKILCLQNIGPLQKFNIFRNISENIGHLPIFFVEVQYISLEDYPLSSLPDV